MGGGGRRLDSNGVSQCPQPVPILDWRRSGPCQRLRAGEWRVVVRAVPCPKLRAAICRGHTVRAVFGRRRPHGGDILGDDVVGPRIKRRVRLRKFVYRDVWRGRETAKCIDKDLV